MLDRRAAATLLVAACTAWAGEPASTTWTGEPASAAWAGDAASAPAATLPPGWVRLADMPARLAKFGVAALAGTLVVAGGYDTQRGVWVYDIASNTWRSAAPLPRGSDNMAAVAAGGKVYAIGGEAGTAVQVYDPATQSWSLAPALPGVRFASAAALLGNQLHVVGGWNANNAASASLASQVVFDLASQAWRSAAAMATPRNAAAAAVLDDRLYVLGGRSPGIRASDQQAMASVEVYSATTRRWAAGTALPAARASLSAVALGGRIYALGGEGPGGVVSNAVERWDAATNAWAALPAMPYKAHGLGAVTVGPSIYVMGGFSGPSDAVGSESAALYRYTPAP